MLLFGIKEKSLHLPNEVFETLPGDGGISLIVRSAQVSVQDLHTNLRTQLQQLLNKCVYLALTSE